MRAGPNRDEQRGDGLSVAGMLGIIGAALLVAGLIAYRLVAPFFHH